MSITNVTRRSVTRRSVTRRSVLRTGVAAGAVAGLGLPAFAADTRLRMFWWGSKERADRTETVNKLYSSQKPASRITGEILGWGDYWPRLATQVGRAQRARRDPDGLPLHLRICAPRRARSPLDPYMPASPSTSAISARPADRQRQGRRQALWRQPRAELRRDGLRHRSSSRALGVEAADLAD